MEHPEIITITKDNVDKEGFFCYMSKKKAPGYANKLEWLKKRFDEGLRIKMIKGERCFIEYIPGEFACRAVNAKGYMLIHCLWVVGQSKGKGLSKLLIDECIRDARESGCAGVAMVTSERVWLVGKQVFEKAGFSVVDEYAPFHLLVKKFADAPDPTFPNDWQNRLNSFGDGMTITYSNQCPYIFDAVKLFTESAKKKGVDVNIVELNSPAEIQEKAVTPYGVFNVIYNKKLFSYYYMLEKEFNKRFEEIAG